MSARADTAMPANTVITMRPAGEAVPHMGRTSDRSPA